jgi:hypothetical protein
MRRQGEAGKILHYLYNTGWKILYLKRENLFRKAVSSLVAPATNRWHVKEGNRPGECVTVDPNQLFARMKWYEETIAKEEVYLEGIPHLTIVYEEGLMEMSNHQKTMDAVFAYIGVSSVGVKTRWRRTISGRLSETIENYEEIYNMVCQTPYAKFLQ